MDSKSTLDPFKINYQNQSTPSSPKIPPTNINSVKKPSSETNTSTTPQTQLHRTDTTSRSNSNKSASPPIAPIHPPPPPPHRATSNAPSGMKRASSINRKPPPPLPQQIGSTNGPSIPSHRPNQNSQIPIQLPQSQSFTTSQHQKSISSPVADQIIQNQQPQQSQSNIHAIQQPLPSGQPQLSQSQQQLPSSQPQSQSQQPQIVSQQLHHHPSIPIQPPGAIPQQIPQPHSSQSHNHNHNNNNNTRPPSLEKLTPGTLLTVGQHHVKIVKYLSAGGFAHIYVVKINPIEQGKDIACLKRVIVPNKEGLNQLRAEVEVMQRLAKSDNIVRYYDSNASRLANSPGCYEVLVLMELCPNKSLLDFMNTRLRTKLTVEEILRIMLDISKAVYNMHKMKLIHRDIKIENVLLDENFNFKLADFGSTCPILRVPRNQQEFQILHNDILLQTTPQYRSPEMIDLYRGLPIDEKSDIWALGVFLYKLCYYTTPFEIAGELSILHSAYNFPAQPHFPSSLRNLINIMLQENPIFRPNIYQVLIEVCKLSGFNSELTNKIIDDGYKDFYGLGNYQYPSNDQIHPAIEPFTSSLVPMFSPFKSAPRDPLEIQMELKQNLLKQQQQHQQQQQQTASKSMLPNTSSKSLNNVVNSSPPLASHIPTSTNKSESITVDNADPFSMNNLKRSSGTNVSIKSIPKISITENKSSSTSEFNNLNKTGVSSGSQFSFNNSNITGSSTALGISNDISQSVDDFNEMNLINNYEISKHNSSINIGSDTNISLNNDKSIDPKDSDQEISENEDFNNTYSEYLENVENRFPKLSTNNSVNNVNLTNNNNILNQNGNSIEISNTNNNNNNNSNNSNNILKVEDKKSKRFSSNNPFPLLNSEGLERENTGGSIISFDDIKDELIDFDESKTVNDSVIDFENTKNQADINIKSIESPSNTGGKLKMKQQHKKLSAEQLTEEVIDFSDEEDE